MSESFSKQLISTVFGNTETNFSIEDDRYNACASKTKSRFSTSGSYNSNEVLSVEFNSIGSLLAYSRLDGSMTIWTINHPKYLQKIYKPDICGQDKLVTSICWNPKESSQFITTSNNHEIILWNVDSKLRKINRIKSFPILHETIKLKFNNCTFDPTGNICVASTKSGHIYLFNFKNGAINENSADISNSYSTTFLGDVIPNFDSIIRSIIWNNSGEYLFIGLKDGDILVLKLDSEHMKLSLIFTIKSHSSSIIKLALDPWGKYLFSACNDGIVAVWDLKTLCCKKIINDINDSILSIDVDSEGFVLGVTTESSNLHFYDLDSFERIYSNDLSETESDPILKFYTKSFGFIISDEHNTLKYYYSSKSYKDLFIEFKENKGKLLVETPKEPKRVHERDNERHNTRFKRRSSDRNYNSRRSDGYVHHTRYRSRA